MSANRLGAEVNEPPDRGLPYVSVSKILQGSKWLHIYIGGDGLPWVNGGRSIAVDPSYYRILPLELMKFDDQSSVFLGRPCYFLHKMSVNCLPELWTSSRYGEQILEQMQAAVATTIAEHPKKKVALIGYSGGGALAVLLANRMLSISRVVTIAGNLDVEGWVDHHSYLPLRDSINPYSQDSKDHYQHLMLAGADDSVVPIALLRNMLNVIQ